MNKEKVLTNALVQFRSLGWGWRIQLQQTKSALSYWDWLVSNGDCGHDVLNRALSGKSMNGNFQSLWVCGVVIILINWLISFLHSSYTSINPILDLLSILLSMHTCPHTFDTICVIVWLGCITYIHVYHWKLMKSNLICACYVSKLCQSM